MGGLSRIFICIFILVSGGVSGQVFFDSDRIFYSETDALFIPTIHFSYGMKEYEFVEKNTGLSVGRKYLNPGIYFGGMLLTDGWAMGLHFDPFNMAGMMVVGCNIPVRIGKRNKK
jgi:hypothetical protein